MMPTEILQFTILCTAFFAAWKLDAINRTLGEVTTQISFLKEEIVELKDSFREISERVDKAEHDLKKIIKLEEESNGK